MSENSPLPVGKKPIPKISAKSAKNLNFFRADTTEVFSQYGSGKKGELFYYE